MRGGMRMLSVHVGLATVSSLPSPIRSSHSENCSAWSWLSYSRRPSYGCVAAACVNGDSQILVCAGDDGRPLHSCELCDLPTGSCTFVAPVPNDENNWRSYAFAVHDNLVYATNWNTRWFATYNPDTNTWTRLASLPDTAKTRSMAAYNANLITCGTGDSKAERLTYNPANNVWSKMASLNYPQPGGNLVVHENELYAIGNNFDIVEIYDKEEKKWMYSDTKLCKPTELFMHLSVSVPAYCLPG